MDGCVAERSNLEDGLEGETARRSRLEPSLCCPVMPSGPSSGVRAEVCGKAAAGATVRPPGISTAVVLLTGCMPLTGSTAASSRILRNDHTRLVAIINIAATPVTIKLVRLLSG